MDEYQYGLPWYLRHFPLRSAASRGMQAFEASPSYLFHPLAAGRIRETIPEVKMIALLRNPTERAISHYLHKKRNGIELLPMLEAFQQEEARLTPIVESGDYFNRKMRHYSYKARGLYKVQLERYFDLFPKDQILVIPSEAFFCRTGECLKQIYGFIGVDDGYQLQDPSPRFVNKNKETVPPEVYEYLNDYFKPHNEALYKLLGVDFGW
jgi:hypothetical protein